MLKKTLNTLTMTYKVARRIVITTIGATVLLLGVVMIFLPGPAFIVIPAGLAILGLEFAWARYWLGKLKTGADTTLGWFRKSRYRKADSVRQEAEPAIKAGSASNRGTASQSELPLLQQKTQINDGGVCTGNIRSHNQ